MPMSTGHTAPTTCSFQLVYGFSAWPGAGAYSLLYCADAAIWPPVEREDDMGTMFELEAFANKAKTPRWFIRAKWQVGWKRDFVLDQEQAEALIAALKPGADRQTLVWLRDTLVEKGHWGVPAVKVEKTETPDAPLIKPPPSVVPGNTGPRKMETARMSEPKKKKAKTEPKKKSEPKSEVSMTDLLAVLQNMNATVQNLSGRMDAMEDAATAPVGGPDF